ncbi:hypothetical protein IWW38_006527, partial [Coemansia aciculifera]
ATVEIPPNHRELPNEIHKIGLDEDSAVPFKIRGVLAHARDALRRVEQFDCVLREFEDRGSMAPRFEGQIKYPVELAWDWDVTAAADYVPPGLRRRRSLAATAAAAAAATTTTTTSVSNTAGSTTVVANNIGRRPPPPRRPADSLNHNHRADPPVLQRRNIDRVRKPQEPPQWNAHVLDRRTVDDTPTRRLNLGPITRLVQEFNHAPSSHATPAKPSSSYHHHHHAQYNNILRTPAAPNRSHPQHLVLHTPANPAAASKANILEAAQLAFHDACFIPDVGWCMAATTAFDGEEEEADPDDYVITMLFNDGCRVLVRAKDQVAS